MGRVIGPRYVNEARRVVVVGWLPVGNAAIATVEDLDDPGWPAFRLPMAAREGLGIGSIGTLRAIAPAWGQALGCGPWVFRPDDD